MVIGVDVDLTVVDTLTVWLNWYEKQTGHNVKEKVKGWNGNIETLMHKHKSPLEFWKIEDLYENLEPIEHSVEILERLSKCGHEIIFVSSCFAEHYYSKEKFLEKHFPFKSGFISTKEKWHTDVDVMIDDFDKNLNEMSKRKSVKTYQFKTLLNQKGYDWREIGMELGVI